MEKFDSNGSRGHKREPLTMLSTVAVAAHTASRPTHDCLAAVTRNGTTIKRTYIWYRLPHPRRKLGHHPLPRRLSPSSFPSRRLRAAGTMPTSTSNISYILYSPRCRQQRRDKRGKSTSPIPCSCGCTTTANPKTPIGCPSRRRTATTPTPTLGSLRNVFLVSVRLQLLLSYRHLPLTV